MRKVIFWLHLVTGVLAGIVILFMSVTGVLLTYQRQMTERADGAYVSPPANGSRLPVESLWEKVVAAEQKPPSTIVLHSDPKKAATFSYGREKTVFLNPYSGEILGEGSKSTRAFFQTMIEWHRYLGMAGERRDIGKAITGACNLGFLFLVVSGFYLWWPRKWTTNSLRAILRFDFSLKGKARDWNWHNVIGFWSAIPLFIIVFTAMFFNYPWANEYLYKAMGHEPPPRQAPPANRPSTETATPSKWNPSGLNAHWAAAESQVKDWQTITLRVPTSAKAPLNFTIDRGSSARPDLRSQLTINQSSGAVEKHETYKDHIAPRKARFWIRWLHTGEAGGFIGQTIAGLASLAGVFLVVTGISLAIRRFFKRKDQPA